MSLKIASWNIEGRLSAYATRGRGTPDKIIDEIERLDADVVILPEAYDKSIGVSDVIEKRIEDLRYEHIYDVEYQQAGPPRMHLAVDEPYLRVMSRLAFDKTEIIRPGNLRNMADVTVTDPDTGKKLRIIGVHLDARSEAARLRQGDGLIELANRSTHEMVMQGDWNDMYSDSKLARFMRSYTFRLIAQSFPNDILSDFLLRSSDMAFGRVLENLVEQTTLRDVDPKHQPTSTPRVRGYEWLPSIRIMGIDHGFKSQGVTSRDFKVGNRDSGSDHRPVSVTVSHP